MHRALKVFLGGGCGGWWVIRALAQGRRKLLGWLRMRVASPQKAPSIRIALENGWGPSPTTTTKIYMTLAFKCLQLCILVPIYLLSHLIRSTSRTGKFLEQYATTPSLLSHNKSKIMILRGCAGQETGGQCKDRNQKGFV